MALRLPATVVLLVACSAYGQDADPNLQNLLISLTTGGPTTLVTPLRNGMAQVTTFEPGTRLTAAQANLMISQARDSLRALGEPQPNVEEIARMLAGGPIELQSGRIQTPGMLRSAGWPAAISSQVMTATAPLPSAGASAAAAGGTVPPVPSPAANAAREEAIRQLAALGIINPSEQQIRAALVGGTITTLNGAYELPGILPR